MSNNTNLKEFLEREQVCHYWYYEITIYNPITETFGDTIRGTADALLHSNYRLANYEIVDVQCHTSDFTRTVIVEAIK